MKEGRKSEGVTDSGAFNKFHIQTRSTWHLTECRVEMKEDEKNCKATQENICRISLEPASDLICMFTSQNWIIKCDDGKERSKMLSLSSFRCSTFALFAFFTVIATAACRNNPKWNEWLFFFPQKMRAVKGRKIFSRISYRKKWNQWQQYSSFYNIHALQILIETYMASISLAKHFPSLFMRACLCVNHKIFLHLVLMCKTDDKNSKKWTWTCANVLYHYS